MAQVDGRHKVRNKPMCNIDDEKEGNDPINAYETSQEHVVNG